MPQAEQYQYCKLNSLHRSYGKVPQLSAFQVHPNSRFLDHMTSFKILPFPLCSLSADLPKFPFRRPPRPPPYT